MVSATYFIACNGSGYHYQLCTIIYCTLLTYPTRQVWGSVRGKNAFHSINSNANLQACEISRMHNWEVLHIMKWFRRNFSEFEQFCCWWNPQERWKIFLKQASFGPGLDRIQLFHAHVHSLRKYTKLYWKLILELVQPFTSGISWKLNQFTKHSFHILDKSNTNCEVSSYVAMRRWQTR